MGKIHSTTLPVGEHLVIRESLIGPLRRALETAEIRNMYMVSKHPEISGAVRVEITLSTQEAFRLGVHFTRHCQGGAL